MTIIKKSDPANDLTVFTAEESLTFDQIQKTIDEFHAGAATENVLWDLSGITVWNLSGNDVERLACSASRMNSPRKSGRTAIVAPDRLTGSLSKLFALYGESVNVPIRVEVFQTIEDALQWITA